MTRTDLRLGSTTSAVRLAWTLARGWNLHTAGAVVATVGVIMWVLPDVVRLPSLLSLSTTYGPTGSLAAGVVAAALLTTTREPASHLAWTGARHLALTRLARLTGLLVPALLVLATPWPHLAVATSSTLLALIGEGLLSARLAGPALAWTAPLCHLTAATVFGHASSGDLRWWAWIVAVEPSAAGLVATAGLLALGVSAWGSARPRTA